jgi:hypothetical protein
MYVIVPRGPHCKPIGPFETAEAAERYAIKHCGPQEPRVNQKAFNWLVTKLRAPVGAQAAA